MIGGLFKSKDSRKFRYTPRFFDTKSHDLVNRRIGDSRFAERYVARRKALDDTTDHTTQAKLDQSKIDLQSYRAKNKRADRAISRNTFFIFAILMLFVFIMWMITNPNFGNFFPE